MKVAMVRWPLPFFVAVFTIFAFAAPDGFVNGDAVVYAEQIRQADFAERTTHLGYYLIAYPFSLLPFSLSHVLNILNCAFGAGVVVLVGLIGEAVTGSKAVGPLSAIVVAANGFLVGNALHAEVYISQAFFLLLAVYLWQRSRPIAAGLGCGAAFLVSASSVLAAPFFAVMRPDLRKLLLLGAATAAVAGAALLPVIDNYLFGARGLLGAAGHAIDYELATLKTGRDVFYGFFALLPFLFAGAFECGRRPELRRFGLAVAALWVSVFAFGEKYMDVPVQLPTYMLAGIVVAIGIDATLSGERAPAVLGAMAAFCLIGGILIITPFIPDDYADHLPSWDELALYATATLLTFAILLTGTSVRRVAAVLAVIVACNLTVTTMSELEIRKKLNEIEALARRIRATSDAIVVASDWNQMVRLNWLVHGRAYDTFSFNADALDLRHSQRDVLDSFVRALELKSQVIVLEPSSSVMQLMWAGNYRRDFGTLWWLKND